MDTDVTLQGVVKKTLGLDGNLVPRAESRDHSHGTTATGPQPRDHIDMVFIELASDIKGEAASAIGSTSWECASTVGTASWKRASTIGTTSWKCSSTVGTAHRITTNSIAAAEVVVSSIEIVVSTIVA